MRCLLGTGALALLLAIPVARAQDSAPGAIVAQCGTVSMTAADVQALVAQADPDVRELVQKDPAALARLVRNRLLELVLLDEARAKKWDQTPEVAARAAQARDQVIVESYLQAQTPADPAFPAEADIAAAYEANKARFLVPRQDHLAQIFVAGPQDAPRASADEAEKKLRDVRQALGRPHADFADIARRVSDDHVSAKAGGDMGWAREDALIPAIRTVVGGMQENTVADPVRAADGWHIVKLLGTRPAGPAPLADVRDSIVRALRQQRAVQAAQAYENDILRRQPVQVDEIQLSRIVKR